MLNFLDNRKLWWFTGEDPYVLGNCSVVLRKRFGAIGLLVILICLISSISITYAVDQILESILFDVVIGLYFAAFVFVLYLFLLYTLSRNVLPSKSENRLGRFSSYLIRISFLIFLGFFVSQPIIYNILRPQVENELEIFKVKEIKNFNDELNKEYAKKLQAKRIDNENLLTFKSLIRNNSRVKNRELRAYISRINSKNLFIQKIILMNSEGSLKYASWFLSIILVFIFILPALMKNLVSFSSNYYKTKRNIQTKLIDKHYSRFVNSYNTAISKFTDEDLSLKSKFLNPPYNTVLVKEIEVKNESDFIKWLLNESN